MLKPFIKIHAHYYENKRVGCVWSYTKHQYLAMKCSKLAHYTNSYTYRAYWQHRWVRREHFGCLRLLSLFCGRKRETENRVTFQTVCKTEIRRFHYNLLEHVAGSILDGVVGNFHWLHLSGRTVGLGSTQSGSKGGLRLGLTTLTPSCADCL
jgi:hypothetical protein